MRRLGWAFVVWVILWIGYGQVGRHVLRPIALRQIEELTGAKVAVEDIGFEGWGSIKIKELKVSSNDEVFAAKEMLGARRVECQFSVMSLLRLKPRLKRVEIRDFVLNGMLDVAGRKWNLASVSFDVGPDSRGRAAVIAAEDGIVNIYRVEEGRVRPMVVVHGDGRLGPVAGKRDCYSFYVGIDDQLGFGDSYCRGIWQGGANGRVSLSEGQLLMGKSPVLGNAWNMKNLSGEVVYGGGDILLKDMKWRIGSKGSGMVEGAIRDWKGKANCDIRARLDNWRLTPRAEGDCLVYGPEVMKIISTGLRKFLETCSPEGKGGVDVRMRGNLGDWPDVSWSGQMWCDDISVRHSRFPYLMEHMKGRLELPEETEQMDVRFENLVCRHGAAEMVIDGEAVDTGGRWGYDVRLTSGNMVLDKDLYEALDDRQKELWSSFSPSGAAGIEFSLSFDGLDRKVESLDVELKGASAVYKHFAYPLENLTGRMKMEKEQVTFTDVVSRYTGDARMIRLNGTVEDINSDNPRFNMIIDATNIPIDSTLRTALPEKQREFYEHFDVKAVTDSHITVFPNEVGKRMVEYIADVSIKGGSMMYREFPLPLTDVDVEARLTADKIILRRMTGRNAEGRIDVRGDIWPATEAGAKAGFCLNVEAEKLQLDEAWLSALPAEAGEAAARLRPGGQINVRANINVDAPAADCNDVHVVIECLGNSFSIERLPYAFRDVTGTVEIRQRKGVTEEATDKDVKFNLGFYGGRVVGSAYMKELEGGEVRYVLDTLFDEVRIADMPAVNPEKVYATSQGTGSGSIGVRGLMGDPASSMGRISIGVRDMKMARRSLIGKVLAAMQLNEPSDYIFSDMSAEAFVKGNEIIFDRILMSGKSVVLLGSGKLDLKSNDISLKFNSYGTEVTSYPSFFETLARGLGSAVVQVEVYGNMDDPQIETKSLPVLKNPLRILGEQL
jgi:hypothetical protein